jgi:hypothetical protein
MWFPVALLQCSYERPQCTQVQKQLTCAKPRQVCRCWSFCGAVAAVPGSVLTNNLLAHNVLEVLQHLGNMLLIALDTIEP